MQTIPGTETVMRHESFGDSLRRGVAWHGSRDALLRMPPWYTAHTVLVLRATNSTIIANGTVDMARGNKRLPMVI